MNTRQHGFTLIEVMVAIMLMAIVSLIAWRGLDSVTRADSHLQASMSHTEDILRTFNQLERDLTSQASSALGEPTLNGQSEDREARMAAPPAISVRSADDQTFELDVIRHAAAPDHGLQRVRWWLKGQTLYRAAATPRNRYPLPAPANGVAVLGQIKDLQIRVWDREQGWRQLSGNRAQEPLGLEMRLTRMTERGEEHYRQVWGPFY